MTAANSTVVLQEVTKDKSPIVIAIQFSAPASARFYEIDKLYSFGIDPCEEKQ